MGTGTTRTTDPARLAGVETLLINPTTRVGGAETSLLEFLSAVPPEERNRFAVVHPDATGALCDRVDHLGYLRVPIEMGGNLQPLPNPVQYIRVVRAISRVVASAPVQTVYSNQVSAGPLLTAVKLRNPSVRTVLHVRDHRRPVGAAYRHVPFQDAAVFNSGFVREEALDSRLLRALTRAEAHVVYNCVDAAAARVRAAEVPDVPLPGAGLTVGMFGRFEAWKGFDYAVEQLCSPALYDRFDRLLVVGVDSGLGDPAYEAAIREQIDRLDTEGKVHLLPFQDNVWPVYAACDLVVVPSYREPFGRVAIEAGVLGIPVLAANSGGLREIVRDGVTGRLFDHEYPESFHAAAASLLSDATTRATLGSALRDAVEERFSPAAYHASMRAILDPAE